MTGPGDTAAMPDPRLACSGHYSGPGIIYSNWTAVGPGTESVLSGASGIRSALAKLIPSTRDAKKQAGLHSAAPLSCSL